MSRDDLVLTEEFRRALDLLAAGRHLFLTGKAGTGKSTLIRQFTEKTDRNVVVAAPTGIAALNVGGYTIHRLFGLTATTTLDDIAHGSYRPGRFTKTLAALDTLIVDEASMIRADLFDQIVTALERFGPKPRTPFGGVQIVLVGDLFQLPPVVTEPENEYFATRYATPYFFSADRFDRADFTTVALTTVFRQRGDAAMTSILNAIREGVLTGQAHRDLGARVDEDFEPPADELWLTLATTNRLVASRNRDRLERLPGEEHIHAAERIGELTGFEAPTDEVLRFKVGAQVMMLTNDPAERWVNGTLGRITAIGRTQAGATTIGVRFTDGTSAEVGAHTWEVTRPTVAGGRLRHEVIGSYTQLPFKLAWAITIHKSQGQTLDRLVVDLRGGTFATGQLYVALSRCTSLSGLVLRRPVLPRDLKVDRRIMRFLREAATPAGPRRHCGIGVLTVGEEGQRSRPRPVEIAVAFDDGTAISTLVNPQRDLADARAAYGIGVNDVLLAPTLAEAWTLLAPLLAGQVPVGADIDHTLGLVDFELKRLGHTMVLPFGVELPASRLTPGERAALTAGTALARARAALAACARLDPADDAASAFADPENEPEALAYLLSRDPDVAAPAPAHLPDLAAVLEVSRRVAGVLLGTVPGGRRDGTDAWTAAAREAVAAQLKAAAARVPPTDELVERLRVAGELLGSELLDPDAVVQTGPDIEEVLVPGTRVCFSGEASGPDGRPLSREQISALAADLGLAPVATVSKTRCDALIVAELGTQSGKARRAREWGKPVFSAEAFLAWAARRG